MIMYNFIDFNPHTREGCDAPDDPRHTEGGYFNPHTREGCDRFLIEVPRVIKISIHTPVKGVTLELRVTDFLMPLFQSTHP